MKQNYFVPIKGALFCGLLWLMSVVAFAQKSVSGKVSDAKGDGVPGASITVKGTTTGTISDANGGFKINVGRANTSIWRAPDPACRRPPAGIRPRGLGRRGGISKAQSG